MADQWDLTKRIEENPGDHALRWRLAKKLYRNGEYRLALEHLQVLKKEQEPQINAERFLAATLFRLGRFEEAAKALQESLERWPKEIGLYQQLARALEAAGQPEEAANHWDHILKVDPKHPFAARAAKRLREEKTHHEQTEFRAAESDPALDLMPGVACPHCRAQNSGEFERCWQCHSPLPASKLAAARQEDSDAPEGLPPEVALRIANYFSAVCLALAAVLSGWLLFGRYAGAPPVTLEELYNNALAWTRIGTGVGLVVLWPFAFSAAARMAGGIGSMERTLLSRLAMGFAALAYLSSWLPGDKLAPILLFPGLISLSACLFLLPIEKVRAIGIWAVQMVLAAVIGMSVFVLLEWAQVRVLFNPVVDISAISTYVREHGAEASKGFTVAEGPCPISGNVRLHSTGSRWLDARAGHAILVAQCETGLEGRTFELAKNGSTEIYEQVAGSQWRKEQALDTASAYTLALTGPPEGVCKIELRTLLKVEFESKGAP